jgi:protein Mpv17
MNSIIRLGSLTNNILRFKTLGAKLREKNTKLFTKYLLITNLTISTTFSGLGDFLEQSYELAAGYQSTWDKKRTVKLASTGLPVGFVCHHWYLFLDRYITGRTGKCLVKKFLLDQLIGSPLYIIVFFISMGIWNGWSKKQLKEELVSKGGDIYTAEWIVWPPAQLINFYFLPTRFRLLYDSTISLGFDTYFSYVTHKDQRENKIPKKNDNVKIDEVKLN